MKWPFVTIYIVISHSLYVYSIEPILYSKECQLCLWFSSSICCSSVLHLSNVNFIPSSILLYQNACCIFINFAFCFFSVFHPSFYYISSLCHGVSILPSFHLVCVNRSIPLYICVFHVL